MTSFGRSITALAARAVAVMFAATGTAGASAGAAAAGGAAAPRPPRPCPRAAPAAAVAGAPAAGAPAAAGGVAGGTGAAGAGGAPNPPSPAAFSCTPLTHTRAVLRIGPSDSVSMLVPWGTSTVRVNHTIPSKSVKPRDSQLPGTCMSFHDAAISWVAGVRQSGVPLPMPSGTGNDANGSLFGSAL